MSEPLDKKKTVALCAAYLSAAVFILVSLVSLIFGAELSTAAFRALIALAIAWPAGLLVGYLGVSIFSNSESEVKSGK